MSEEFVIENGVLSKYNGPGGAVVIPAGVTGIAWGAFEDCKGLESVTLPEGLLEIGPSAFSGCSALQSVTLSESLLKIGHRAFSGCSALQSVTIPEGVARIGEDAFRSCGSLQSVTIPEGVAKIGEYAFSDCSTLQSVTMPESLLEIGNGAFSGCSALQSVAMPESLLEIGDSAFSGCSALQSIAIPEGVEKIGQFAFGNAGLTRLHLPKSVTSLGYDTFFGCVSLEELTIDPENPRYHISEGVVYDKKDVLFCLRSREGSVTVEEGTEKIAFRAFTACKKITEVILPGSVTSIGADTFQECDALERLVLPKKLKKLSKHTASYCPKLTELTLPEALEEIGGHAFYDTGLRSVTVPGSVETVGSSAFGWCGNLEEVTLEDGVKELRTHSFQLSPVKRLTILGEDVSIVSSAFDWDGVETLRADRMRIADLPKGRCRDLALTAFCRKYLAGEDTPLKEEHLKYIKAQRKKLFPLAVREPEVLRVMFREKFLTNKDVQPLLDEADKLEDTGAKAAAKAAVLEFSRDMEPVDPLGEMEKELARAERAAERLKKTGSLPVGELKKLWGYEKTEDGITLTSWKGKDGPQVTIPARIGKDPVKAIGEFAFAPLGKPKAVREAREALESVTIPEGVTEIGFSAFSGCWGLRSITIPESVVRIRSSAFSAREELTIRAPAGSCAEQYAKEHSIRFEAHAE